MAPQAAGFCRSGRIDFLLAQKYELLQSNSRLLRCERVMETRVEFHFSWLYTFSATLSSLRNWANNDRYRLRPSTPAQLCWSSSRLQLLQNYNLIKFALIRTSTLNHDRNLWNFRGAPDETTCFAVFFSVPQRLNFIFAWSCLMFVPINSLSIDQTFHVAQRIRARSPLKSTDASQGRHASLVKNHCIRRTQLFEMVTWQIQNAWPSHLITTSATV